MIYNISSLNLVSTNQKFVETLNYHYNMMPILHHIWKK